jgi:hypothetical protein
MSRARHPGPHGPPLGATTTACTAARPARHVPAAVVRALLAAALALCCMRCGGGFLHDNENAAEFDEAVFGADTSDTGD